MGICTETHIPSPMENVVSLNHSIDIHRGTESIKSSPTCALSAEESRCLFSLHDEIKRNDAFNQCGIQLDDMFLLAFVRGKNCDFENALCNLKNYVNVRKHKYTKFFRQLSPRNFHYILDGRTGPRFAGILRLPGNYGRDILILRCNLFNPRVHKGEDVIQAFVAAGQELLLRENSTRNGIILLVDSSGFGFRHAREFTMSRIYMFIQLFLSSYPIKYKGFHILNNTYLFDTILTVIKQLIPRKLRDRIHLHGSSLESLHQHIPAEVLPTSFGGCLTDEEAFDSEFEQALFNKTDHYEKLAL